jgi:hypothetical protein
MTDSEAFNATKFSFCACQSAESFASLFRSCDLDALTPLARATSCLPFRGSTPRTFASKSSLQLRYPVLVVGMALERSRSEVGDRIRASSVSFRS